MELNYILATLCGIFEVRIRKKDGFISATDLCRLHGKSAGHYLRNKCTERYIAELSEYVNTPAAKLFEIVKYGKYSEHSIWVCPYIAINILSWISPVFIIYVHDVIIRCVQMDMTLRSDVIAQNNNSKLLPNKWAEIMTAKNPDAHINLLIREAHKKNTNLDKMIAQMEEYKFANQIVRMILG